MSTEAKKKRSGRAYRKRLRAEHEAETRERIAAATARLHQTVGPARTTVSGVAREAGVQRATVYRHFPTEESLYDACTAHYYARHPRPDVGAWETVRDPEARLRRALTEVYAYFAETEDMFDKTGRDRGKVPAMEKAVANFNAYFERAVATLRRGRRERGRPRARVAGAIGHALSFPTWQSLVRVNGLEPDEAVELMLGTVAAAGRGG
jgi:AcrR family transcriptional regulator